MRAIVWLATTAAAASVAPRGFIGLGIMGEGMASNLLQAGTPLHVWSRDRSVCTRLSTFPPLW